MGKPRFVVTADGRIGCPEVMVYQTDDGARLPCPPKGERSYIVVVFDLKRYEAFRDSGWLYGEQHMGPFGEVIDRSATS